MINNDFEFALVFSQSIEKATDYVIQQILIEYKDLIRKIVYDAYNPIRYQRTGGMLDIWKTNTVKKEHGAEGILNQDANSMVLDEDLWQHGNPWSGDLRLYVANMIYEGYGYASDPNNLQDTAYSRPRDAWQPLQDELKSGMLDKLFTAGMKMQGLEIRKWGKDY